MNVERIHDGRGNLLALILYRAEAQPGLQFFTEPDCGLQLGCMIQPARKRVEAHVHNTLPRGPTPTGEVLFVRRGLMRVTLYASEPDALCELENRVLRGGDIILLYAGGHGIEFLEETEVWEVRQGPYLGAAEKTYLAQAMAGG